MTKPSRAGEGADLAKRSRAGASRLKIGAAATVIASVSEAIQTKPPPQSPSLDRFALLAMTTEVIRLECIML